MSGLISESDAIDVLRSVYDGCCEERRISIVDLGLVDRVEVRDDSVQVDLVLTTGWCPFSTNMLTQAKQLLEKQPGVREALVQVTWDRHWTPDRMEPALAARTRLLPVPARATDWSALAPLSRHTKPTDEERVRE